MLSKYRFHFLTFLLITLSFKSTFSQSRQQQKTDSVLQLVNEHLAIKDADGIYALAGELFRKSLNIETFRKVADQQLFPLGAIRKWALISFVNNKTATYKVQFETLTMEVLLSLDEKDKLELFYFRPYKIESGDKVGMVATSNPLKSLQDKKVDSAARVYIQKLNTVGLSIGIIKNGAVAFYNYGETTKDSKQIPTAETIYEIGSITKTFTATILASYVNDGRVKLDDPIIKYLPDSVAGNAQLKNITLLNLINHTSGLPFIPDNLESQKPYDKLNPYANYNKTLLYAYLKTCKLQTRPGEHYAYSNLAVGILGTILEKISSKSFEEMTSAIVCSQLDMPNTLQHLYPLIKIRFAPVYNEDSEQTIPWAFNALASCGALRSTINDLVKYAKANLNDDAATPIAKAFKLTHEITYNNDARLGLAWHIIKIDGTDYYFHNGGTYGSSSFLAFNKEKNLAVVILSNASANTDNLGVDLIKKLQ